jgi:hypothetical protein
MVIYLHVRNQKRPWNAHELKETVHISWGSPLQPSIVLYGPVGGEMVLCNLKLMNHAY